MKHTLFVVFFWLALIPSLQAQSDSTLSLKGKVIDDEGLELPYVLVTLTDLKLKTITDIDGVFVFEKIPQGTHTISITALGYTNLKQSVTVATTKNNYIELTLTESALYLDEAIVARRKQTEAEKTEQTGFHVDVVELEQFASQSVDINSVLDHTAGVRVQRSGGMGSDFVYSLDGMKGNSIRFLVDGIPIDFFGSVYNINNFPVSLIDRIEIYKGVVPVYLAADALGGAINIITKTKQSNFVEASYSLGSFNTHQVALQGQVRDSTSGFTTRLSGFYNYSDNDYNVWGKTVTYYDESTGFRPTEFTKDDPATRFNDDYKALCLKGEVGFTDVNWTDQFFIGLLASDVNRGVQHGQTMAYVYGDMRYEERFYMPHLSYIKKNIFTDGLNLKIFSSYAITNGVSIDTSTNNYNWKGDIVSVDLDGGERRNQRSLFSLNDKAFTNSFNASYALNDHFEVVFNYLYKGINRTGDDDFRPYHTIPFTEPQYLKTNFTGLSLNTTWLDKRLQTDLFVKRYGYNASVTEENYNDTDSDEQVVAITNKQVNYGGGLANTLKISKKTRLKFSAEKAIRLPDTKEALGNGVNIFNSPYIKPEQSFNINLGLTLGKYYLNDDNSLKFTLNTFFRDTKDKIYPTPSGGRGEVIYENIDKVLGKGAELEAMYFYKSLLEINFNVTYLDQRNNLKETEFGTRNIVYKDRLRNAPYFMANIVTNLKLKHLIQKKSTSFIYCRAGYVHEYYLGWPSLGDKSTKSIIPSQFVLDIGIGYTFPTQKISIALDASNILNAQVYDNFLLQKPGRAFALKLSYRLSKA